MKALNKNHWPITASELERIKESTELARTNLFFRDSGINKAMKEAETKLWSSDEKCHATGVFHMLRLQKALCSVELNSPAIKKAVNAAMERNDSSFFVWMGRILSTNRIQPENKSNKLSIFLLDHWDRAADGLPELFYLTKNGLTNVCEVVLRLRYTEDAITKQCQRLGLVSFSGKKIRVVIEKIATDKNRNLVFQRPDGKRLRWPAPVPKF